MQLHVFAVQARCRQQERAVECIGQRDVGDVRAALARERPQFPGDVTDPFSQARDVVQVVLNSIRVSPL